ncbi:MAG: LysR substrate-binding domain-containing protein [Bariatricus sp.]|nr:LysR substrate-binding domain-containing protein [Bariatricus sp.]
MNKYEIILDVCETHSISRTAEKLNYTQSAISQAIRSYEKELGFPLFKRSKSGMDLLLGTEEIIESLRIICQEENRINRLATKLSGLDTGLIRIGTIQSISYHWLPDILKKFSESYPNINFELTVDGFSALKEKLHSGELDCIFVSRYSMPDAAFIPVGTDELMLVTPLDHPLATKEEISLSDINNENFILSSDGLDYEMGNVFAMNNITPKIRYRLNEDFATLKMVETGFGITVLPRLLLTDAPFQVCVRSFSGHYTRVLGAAYLENVSAAPATLRFLEYIRWEMTPAPRLASES